MPTDRHRKQFRAHRDQVPEREMDSTHKLAEIAARLAVDLEHALAMSQAAHEMAEASEGSSPRQWGYQDEEDRWLDRAQRLERRYRRAQDELAAGG
jgi:hypothetical protein